MAFPDTKFEACGEYADAYFAQLGAAAASVSRARLHAAAAVLTRVHADGGTLFSCGNGGSAAIANHLVCDHCKGLAADTGLRPRIYSLSATIEMITAIGNDVSFDEVFAGQLALQARPGDALVTISSSGNSENIVRACQWARDHDLPVISMTGFAGGRSSELADVNLHVESHNYGVVEDVHQSLMHILAQYLRQAHMDGNLIGARTF